MNYSRLTATATAAAILLAIGLSACDRKTETTVVQPPGASGAAGPAGPAGAPGKSGNTVVIVPVPEPAKK